MSDHGYQQFNFKHHGYVTIVGIDHEEAEEYLRATIKATVSPTWDEECRMIEEAEYIFDVRIYCY